MIVLSENTPTARKEHDCMACEWVWNTGIDRCGFTRPELRTLSKARKNEWRILKGEKYIRATIKDDADIYTFKAIVAVHDICLKYDLYEE